MKQTNIIKSSIITTLLASLALLSGCAVDAGDDSADAGSVELAGTWGGPDHPLPPAMRVESGDVVESYRRICSNVPNNPAALRAALLACYQPASEECTADGGFASSQQSTPLCSGNTCRIFSVVSCLFKASGG